MDIERQRRLFEAELTLEKLREHRDRLLDAFQRFFAGAVVLLLAGALAPYFLLHTENRSVNQLVGLATGVLILSALLVLIISFSVWRNRLQKQLLAAEKQLITAQKAIIQPHVVEPTIQQLLELGFPRHSWSRETRELGSTLVETAEGPLYLKLSYDTREGYRLEVHQPKLS